MGADSALIIIPFALVAVLFFEIAARQIDAQHTYAKANVRRAVRN